MLVGPSATFDMFDPLSLDYLPLSCLATMFVFFSHSQSLYLSGHENFPHFH